VDKNCISICNAEFEHLKRNVIIIVDQIETLRMKEH